MKNNIIYSFLRKIFLGFFTLVSRSLPLWKEDEFVEVLPPMLSIPVTLPVNHNTLPAEFADQFIQTKNIRRRRIFILKDIYLSGAAVVFKNLKVFTPSLTWLRDINHFRKGELLLKQWRSSVETITSYDVVGLVYDNWSATNYYHWMIEALPKLLLLKNKYPDCLLLIPDPAPDFIIKTVKAMGFINVKSFDRNTMNVAKVKKLVLPELVYYEYEEKDVYVPNYKAPDLTSITPSNLHEDELIVAVRKILLQLIPEKPTPNRKIYISRAKQKIRRLVNEAEVLQMIDKYGFETMYFEGMPFLEQMKLMLSTSVFMTLHGSNVVNILFLPEGAKVIEMMNKDYMNDAYYLMASSIKLPYYSVACTMSDETIKLTDDRVVLNNADVLVNVSELEAAINLTLNL